MKVYLSSGAVAAEFFDLVQVPRVKKDIPKEVLAPDERKKSHGMASRSSKRLPDNNKSTWLSYVYPDTSGEKYTAKTFPSLLSYILFLLYLLM